MATKTKQEAVRERVYLTFPKDQIKEPVLSMLSKQFDIVFNIRGSTVTSDMGLVALEIDGKESEVTKAIDWLKAKGITVEPIEKNVIESQNNYCTAAEIDKTKTPPSCGGPPRIKFPLFAIRTVVSSSGFLPSVRRTCRAIRLSWNSCGVTISDRPPGISKTLFPFRGMFSLSSFNKR